jgi:hypothetical protein
MGRRRADSVDLACQDWAKVRRQVRGLEEPKLAREYLGALRSTLGQRRDLHAGATSTGRVEQHYPEVYEGDALTVHRAFQRMRYEMRRLLEVHYVVRAPIDCKAWALAVSPPTYYAQLREAKGFVESELTR